MYDFIKLAELLIKLKAKNCGTKRGIEIKRKNSKIEGQASGACLTKDFSNFIKPLKIFNKIYKKYKFQYLFG
jgi:hypothetical protein